MKFTTEQKPEGETWVVACYTKPDNTGLGGEWESQQLVARLWDVPGGIVWTHPFSGKPLRVFPAGNMASVLREVERQAEASLKQSGAR